MHHCVLDGQKAYIYARIYIYLSVAHKNCPRYSDVYSFAAPPLTSSVT